MITNKAKLSVRNNQLVIIQDEEVKIPLEDIATVLLEENASVITGFALSKFSEYNIALFTCNQKHLPNGVLHGFQTHSRQLSVLQRQYALSKPFKKRIWQRIIIQKLLNQAECLSILGKSGYDELIQISKKVDSGDTTNREAYGAQIYFKYLFDGKFHRRQENTVNIALNYGYSIIRGAVARALVSYGFTPCLGIMHSNDLNNFNLADDFMEVYRPMADLCVKMYVDEEMEFSKEIRAQLYNLLNYNVLFHEEKYSIYRSIEEMIKSFVTACRHDDFNQLKLPQLLPLTLHKYE
ncbi:type II CRISPR-associated endonuclease Cas1 [Thermoflavimicrobium daqui]|uniref:CRISPR-associated endonuclease Cas1 n=2 Tax=Thermoflavimicrobium daqui TaxID=2137476 RepID=A0A364K8V6_9BACL|nr:type II CRISPR-associated endonuclease Cas1 [Thermoflavimicrobium daqui]